MSSAMPSPPFHPRPGQRNASAPKGDCHKQQLMPKTNFAAIHDQTYFSMGQSLDDRLRQRLIPGSDLNGRIIQQPSHSPGHTWQVGSSRYILSHFAQVDTSTFVQPNHQPTEVTNSGDPFTRTKLIQHFATGMVKFWYRHGSPPKLVCGNPSLLDYHAVFYSFVKTVR